MVLQNDFRRQWAQIGPAAMAALERVGSSGWYILGPEVQKFEALLADFCGIRHAVGVGNGMDAIEIALRALNLKPGERVLTTPFSAFATTLAISRAGGVPVFVDVDDNGNVDLEQCQEIIGRDNSLRFFVPVHLYGNPLDLEKLAALRKDFRLIIVEDCAQAIGAKFGGQAAGTIGGAATVSFYPTKNLGALGDGGALLTEDEAVVARARALRHYGQSSLYLHDHLGLNSRLDELQAAVLTDAMLPNLKRWTETRRETAQRYCTEMRGPHVRCLEVDRLAEPVWHLFPVFLERTERSRAQEVLRAAGVQTGVHYPRIIPDQVAMKSCPHEVLVSPLNARRLAASELSLPIHPFLSLEERRLVANTVRMLGRTANGAAG